MRIFITFVLLISFCQLSNAKPSDPLAGARELADAIEVFDVEKIVDLTDPTALNMAGGREAMLKLMTDLAVKLKAIPQREDTIRLAPPSSIEEVNGQLIQFFPYFQEILSRGQKIYSIKSYFIGISKDKGTSWKYIDGVAASQIDIKVLIPGYTGSPAIPTQLPNEVYK